MGPGSYRESLGRGEVFEGEPGGLALLLLGGVYLEQGKVSHGAAAADVLLRLGDGHRLEKSCERERERRMAMAWRERWGA